MTTTGSPAAAHRLRDASSPYLQQHAGNPVEWYPWGPEALERARREDKPIFLSIGYAACHWCHVMAHESFESPDVAAVMNRLFVNIKVDREERPDLDEIYMRATQALNHGQGGWPMSVWLTPALKPFFAGTYFPPTSRWGRPGFVDVCERIGEAWQQRRADIDHQADTLAGFVAQSLAALPSGDHELSLATVDQTADQLAAAFDKTSGGISGGGTNKFPPSMAMDVMLRSAARRRPDDPSRQRLVEAVELTLDCMACGGIYDQLGGGIHRYSTDVEWHVPHFEKMLYDQALVSRIYLDAFQFSGKPLYARIAREILDYVLRDLASPAGGFYSTRDADSEGQEGKYYAWTRAQVVEAVGEEDARLFCAHFDISESGNWSDPHDPEARKSVPRVLRAESACARMLGMCPSELAERIERTRRRLLAVRDQRVAPARDEKILCEWNGLMIGSLARGGCVLAQPSYIAAAARAAEFVLREQYRDGRLRRSLRDGRTLEAAFLPDYANMIEGLLELYEATFERRWLDAALMLNRDTIAHFWDEREGGFFFTPHDHEPLIARSKEARDNAVPSGNSVQLLNLLRLAAMLGDEQLATLARRTIEVFAAEVAESPWSSERFLAALDFARAGPVEVVVVGGSGDPRTQALLRSVYGAYVPNRVLLLLDPDSPDAAPPSPLLRGRGAVGGHPAAYVCRAGVCQAPVTEAAQLARLLAGT